MIRPRRLLQLLFLALLFAACSQKQSPASPDADPIPHIAEPLSPEQGPLTEIDLTIKGVRAGTTEADVVKHLGNPKRIERGPWDNCEYGRHRYLHYDGLTVDVLSDEKNRNFAVTSLELTSDKWSVTPGLRIGDPVSSVRELYGEPISDEDGSLNYGIKSNDGWINFEYHDGKVTRISMRITLC